MSRQDRQWINDQYTCEENHCRNKADFFACVVKNCPGGRRRDLENQVEFPQFMTPELKVPDTAADVAACELMLCGDKPGSLREICVDYCRRLVEMTAEGKSDKSSSSELAILPSSEADTDPQQQRREQLQSSMQSVQVLRDSFKRCSAKSCDQHSGATLLSCFIESCIGTQRTVRKRRNNDAFLQCVHSYCGSHPHRSRMVRCIYENCHQKR